MDDIDEDLLASPRFAVPGERRDFLGAAAIGSAVAALGVAAIGAARLPMPSVFPEANTRVKLGPPAQFSDVAATAVPEHRLWVLSDAGGLYAMSAVCTHLACIVQSQDEAGYFCPCHGSRFDHNGKPTAGPAPGPLHYLKLSLSADGQLQVDKQQRTTAEDRLPLGT